MALFTHNKRKNRSVADALEANAWIRDIDHNLSQQIIDEYLQLADKIQNVVLSQTDEDQTTWVHSADGQYSAKSAYKIQFQDRLNCTASEIIWKTKAPPRCKFFC